MKIKIILQLTLFYSSLAVYSQPALPKVVPPSPEASTLTKMFDYPVSNCTGIPDIGIPLYTINIGQLSVPISLSYHASGRRVDDKTGAVGVGWILNAGGLISRTIYGDPDDVDNFIKYPKPWKKADEITNSLDYTFLAGIDNRPLNNVPQYDTEYDIFTYSVNGISGNFVLKDVENVKIPTLIQKKPYKISWHQNSVIPRYCDYFELIDDNGITYRFGKSIVEGTSYHETSNGLNSWLLTEIIAANKEDTVHFKYTSFISVRKSYSASYTKWTNWTNIQNYPMPLENPKKNPGSVSEEIYSSQRLNEISFKHGKIVFKLKEVSGGLAPDKNLMVEGIEIKNRGGLIIKKIEFKQSILDRLSDGIMPTYKLDSVIFKDQGLIPVESYRLDYYPTHFPETVNVVNIRFSDFWGYYNASGKTDVCPFVPTARDNEIIANPYADRNTNETAMKSGVLRKITYPTGGYTEFFYEANKYYDLGDTKLCGGLRIFQIKSADLNNNIQLRTFKYGISECGYGYLPLIPSISTMSFATQQWKISHAIQSCEHRDTETQYFSNVLPIFASIASKPVIYTQVSEYIGDINNNIGKIEYTYDRDDMLPPTLQAFGSGIVNYRLWKKSDLLIKNIFAKVKNTQEPYSMVKSISNIYTETVYPSETIYGLRIRRMYFLDRETGMCPSDRSEARWCHYGSCYVEEFYASPENGSLPIYAFGDYTISIGKKELTQTIETDYSNNGILNNSTTNIFDSNHLLKEQIIKNSKGINLKKEFLHPIDMTGDPYNKMVEKNMVNPVIQVNEYNNSTPTFSSKTNYSWFLNNSIIAPSYVETRQGTNSFESRIRFHDYDKNTNVLCVSKENDAKFSYLWGYNHTYPVAKIEGSSYNDIKDIVDVKVLNNPASDDALRQELAKLRSSDKLKGAMISTYTYKPLIGMTSQTDPNGITTYYEYDSFGRLKWIKDDDGNILKTFDYHYTGQTK